MKKSKFSEEQIAFALRMAETGTRVAEVCRKLGIAETRVRYGYLRIHILLRREGWCVNHKRVYRIYREEGLNLCRKLPRRHITGSRRMDRPKVECPYTCWSMDFVADSLFNGRRFRALTIVDNYSRECLTIEAGQSIKGQDVAAVIQQLVKERGVPDRIQCDNGAEFQEQFHWYVLDKGINHVYIKPRRPRLKGKVERSHRIDEKEFYRMLEGIVIDDAKLFNEKLKEWEDFYNYNRPHAALFGLTPYERFREKVKLSV